MAGIESLKRAGMLMLVAAELDRDIHLCLRRLFTCVEVLLCTYDYVCMNIIASYPRYSCPATWA